MLSKKLLYLIFILVSFNGGYAGTRDPNISDEKYIKYGMDFHCIGKLYGTYNDGTKFSASAVAIDDHNILTAAHVVENAKSCFIIINNKEFCITNIVIHKKFDTEFGVGDIAIGYSEKSFSLSFYPPLYTENDEVNQVCCISGYGFTGTFNTGAVVNDNKRRAGSNVIDSVFKDLLICTPSKPNEYRYTELEFLIASGDSGGGLFLGHCLAGINSCTMSVDRSPSSKYNEESGHTRISNYVEWINHHKVK